MGEAQYVIFKLAGGEYAIDILSVQEIIRPRQVTKIPNAPQHILGIINLRGQVIPIMDLKCRFRLTCAEQNEESRIIVLQVEERSFGILVDQVYEVVRIKDEQIELGSKIDASIDEAFIKGIAKLNERLVILLNLKAAL